jgi:hypothetical protein
MESLQVCDIANLRDRHVNERAGTFDASVNQSQKCVRSRDASVKEETPNVSSFLGAEVAPE